MKRKRTYRNYLRMFAATAFLFVVLLGMQASAAAFKRVQVSPVAGTGRTKVGNYYFWGAAKGDNDYYLYAGKSKTGAGKALAKIDPFTSRLEVILTDGSTVVYPYYQVPDGKTTIYSIKADGTKKTKYKTITGYIQPLKQYGNRFYYSITDNRSAMGVYCLDLTTKKTTRMSRASGLMGFASDLTRYIYSVVPQSRKVQVKITDARTASSVGTYSIAKKSNARLCCARATSKYMYAAIANAKGTQAVIYRMPINGSGGFQTAATIKPPVGTIGELYLINNSYALYSTETVEADGTAGKDYHYKFTFSDGKSKRITDGSFYNALRTKYYYSY